MFFPLGALGAFGGQFFPGMESGMDVSGKLAALGGQDAFMKALQQAQLGGAENLTPQGGFTPDPGVSSERSQMPTPQAPMAPMAPGMAPPQGGFAGSIPGAQAPPQQPGGAQPPGVPPMQRMASADPSGGTSPGDSPHMLAVKGFEGYSPRATWDYKQYSGGYGTRATPGQQFTPQSADSALQDEWYKAKTAVDRFAPGLPQGPRDALTSLTFNAGTNWMHDQPPSPQALAAGRQAEARAAGQPQGQGAPDRTDAAVLSKAVENLRSGNLLPLQQMAQLIERANPGASPQVKFQALKQGLNLLNASGNQQMQVLQMLLSEQHHKDTLAQQDRQYQERLKADELREERYRRSMPYMDQQKQTAKDAQKTMTNSKLRTDKLLPQLDALADVAKKVQITGNPTFDTWLRDLQSKAGFQSGDLTKYKTMLETIKTEMAGVFQQTLGSLTVSARADADKLAQGILTPTMIQSIKEALKIETGLTQKTTKKIIDQANKNMDYFMKTGERPEEEREEETAAQTTGA